MKYIYLLLAFLFVVFVQADNVIEIPEGYHSIRFKNSGFMISTSDFAYTDTKSTDYTMEVYSFTTRWKTYLQTFCGNYYSPGTPRYGRSFCQYYDGYYSYGGDSVASRVDINQASVLYSLGIKHHCFVLKADTIQIWTDGVKGYSGVYGQKDTTLCAFRIGIYSTSSAPFYGEIYYIRYYRKALSEAEILQNYAKLDTIGFVTSDLAFYYKFQPEFMSSNYDTVYDQSGNGINAYRFGGNPLDTLSVNHRIIHGVNGCIK